MNFKLPVPARTWGVKALQKGMPQPYVSFLLGFTFIKSGPAYLLECFCQRLSNIRILGNQSFCPQLREKVKK